MVRSVALMRRVLAFTAVLVIGVGVAGSAAAQSDSAGGSIGGWVGGSDGAGLAGARIEAANEATGLTRAQASGTDGRFQLLLLPPGEYTVRARLAGYATYEQRGIAVRVGDEVSLRLTLELESVSDAIVVSGAAPALETTRSSPTATLDEGEIRALPLDGRDFVDLVELTPQAVPIGGRISINGARGFMNSFNIDGADSNSAFFGEERGGLRPAFTYSQAAIQEFQVVRSSYDARFGGGGGGVINAVTRSGTNEVRLEAFYFFQDDGLTEEKDALGRPTDGFERRQAGVSLGGPIRRDRLHYFLAYDSQRLEGSLPHQPLFPEGFDEAAFDAELRELGIDPESEFDYRGTNDSDVLLARLDIALGASHRLWLRHNLSDQEGENPSTIPTLGRSANGAEENAFDSTVLGLDSVLGGEAFNELIVQRSFEERPRIANTTALPEMVIGLAAAVLGQNNSLPSDVEEERLQVREDYTRLLGGHTLRLGLDGSRLEFRNASCRFCGGSYAFSSFDDFLAEEPTQYTQAFSTVDGAVSYDSELLALYASEEWRLREDLTLEFGLRYERQDNPRPGTSNPLVPLTAQIPDDEDLAPRVGFAWDPAGDGRSVVRGGAGLFLDPTPSLFVGTALLTNGVLLSRVTLRSDAPGFPEFPARIEDPSGLPAIAPDIYVFDPSFENPETLRLSLGYERQIGGGFTVGAEVTWSETDHLERKKDINLDPTPIGFLPDGRPIYDGGAELDERFGKIIQFVSDVEARYFGISLTARRRFAGRWQFDGSYTYAESRDQDTNERSISPVAEGWPEDHFDLDNDRGWSDYDVRNRLVLSGTYLAPHAIDIAVIFRYRDALPLNSLDSRDLNGDGFFRDRPGPDPALGLAEHLGRNSFRGASFSSLDVRLSKRFRLAGRHEIELIGEAFNLLDEDNFSTFDVRFADGGELNPAFGEPIAALPPQSFQLGARYRF